MEKTKKRKTLKKVKQGVLLGIAALIMLFLLSLTGPMSDQKAIARAETYCSQGLYCSGYHYDKSDNTCIAVFRSKITHEIEKTITVSYTAAEKLYDEYGVDHD